jgi:hypothetical protein
MLDRLSAEASSGGPAALDRGFALLPLAFHPAGHVELRNVEEF